MCAAAHCNSIGGVEITSLHCVVGGKGWGIRVSGISWSPLPENHRLCICFCTIVKLIYRFIHDLLQLLVGSEDFDIRVFKEDEIVAEMTETEVSGVEFALSMNGHAMYVFHRKHSKR